MSYWVHVAAIVRLDSLRGLYGVDDDELLEEIKKHFGKSDSEYKSNGEKSWWNWQQDEWLPAGSEGTCEMSIWENPDKHCAPSHTVSIFGDLRDVKSGDAIVEWFKGKVSDKALDGKGFWVRQAVITIEEEPIERTLTWSTPWHNI